MAKAKERGILMAPRMADACWMGRKSQTRRLVDWKYGQNVAGVEPIESAEIYPAATQPGLFADGYATNASGDPVHIAYAKCRYGVPGDLLWVKETWCQGRVATIYRGTIPNERPSDTTDDWNRPSDDRWRSSLHMPRRLSRTTMELTRVRLERMGDISHEDAVAEGFKDREEFLAYALERNRERNPKQPITMDEFVRLWAWALDFKVMESRGRDGA